MKYILAIVAGLLCSVGYCNEVFVPNNLYTVPTTVVQNYVVTQQTRYVTVSVPVTVTYQVPAFQPVYYYPISYWPYPYQPVLVNTEYRNPYINRCRLFSY